MSSGVSGPLLGVTLLRIPGNPASPRSLSAYPPAPFSSGPERRPRAARTDLLWTSPVQLRGISKQQADGRVSTRDLSATQQFDSLRLNAENMAGGCICVCVRCVCFGGYMKTACCLGFFFLLSHQ